MSKEREAFEVWLRGYIKAKPDAWDMEDYEKDSMFDAWQAAKAQAVPEGFVLVPVETLNEALSWANCAASESWTDAQREEIDKHYEVIENAMIEARAIPEGFKLMPLKATEKMVEAACDISEADETWSFYDIYEAMVSNCEP